MYILSPCTFCPASTLFPPGMYAWELPSPAPSWEKSFLWQEPRSVDILCCDLIAESPVSNNRKMIWWGAGSRWRDIEEWIWPCILKAEKPGQSAGKLAWTEDHALHLIAEGAERSLQARPRCSSKNKSEFGQPLCFLGREDFVFDVLYTAKKKHVLKEDAGQADILWLSPEEEI